MPAPIDPKNVGSFSVINNRVYLTPVFSNRPGRRHQRVAKAERQAEKDRERPTFGASILTGALAALCFAGMSFLFGAPLVGGGLGGLGGLMLFCAWMDYDEKVGKWQEKQNAAINSKLEQIKENAIPQSLAPQRVPVAPFVAQKDPADGSRHRVVPLRIEDGVMTYTLEGDGSPVSPEWLRGEIEAREKQLRGFSTEELVNELRRREKQGEN